MKRFLALIAFTWASLTGAGGAQTPAAPQVWSCLTNCSATSNTYADGAWRAASSNPAFVAATTGTNTNCSTQWWNTAGAIRWRKLADVQPGHCVSARRSTTEDAFLAASVLWPSAPPPAPVDCVMSAWSACSLTTGQETRSVVTPAANGGASCPTDLSRACQLPAPTATFIPDRNPILVGESAHVTWASTNAATCVTTWGATDLAGSADLGPFTFAQTVTLGVICDSFFGQYGASVQLQVREPEPKSPRVLPHFPEDFVALPGSRAHVQWALLETTGTEFDLKATYFWRDAEGVIHQEAWATTWGAVLRYGSAEQNGGRYDESAARAECEERCIVLPDGPLKTEVDAWGARWTVEEIGTVN